MNGQKTNQYLHSKTQKVIAKNTFFHLKRTIMEQKSNNPLEENDFPQAERDRVVQKFQTLSNLYGDKKAEELLTPHKIRVNP